MRELGLAAAELAKRLKMTQSAASYSVIRGEWIAKENRMHSRRIIHLFMDIPIDECLFDKSVDTDELFTRAVENKVAHIPGSKFYPKAKMKKNELRLIRLSALRNNLATNPKRVRIEPLRDAYFDAAMELIIQIFSSEQNIPRHLVPLSKSKSPKWWCVRVGEDVIGAVAAWKDSGQWHWGRFAVDKNFRGLGIGKSMAVESITALFTGIADKIIIEARDITVGIIEKLGGKQTSPPFDFFGDLVTPMELQKEAFLQNAVALKNDTSKNAFFK